MNLILPDFGILFWPTFLVVAVLLLRAFIDLLKTNSNRTTSKIFWFFIIFSIPVAGPILYFTVGREQKNNQF